jgi:hypothetical protein
MAERASEKRKTFTFTEAAALLPDVRRLTEDAYQKVEGLSTRTSSPEELQAAMDEVVSEWARAILALGVDVKGLWLVDFDNGSGYYCWKYPESGLLFYHSYEDGFRGRVRIQ